MAGVKGRSGGHNKKRVEQHVLEGTYRRDRHGPLKGQLANESSAQRQAPEHLDAETRAVWTELASVYTTAAPLTLELAAVHVRLHREFHQRFIEAQKANTATSALIRAIRQEAQIVRALVASLDYPLPNANEAPDPWAEFDEDNPLSKYVARNRTRTSTTMTGHGTTSHNGSN